MSNEIICAIDYAIAGANSGFQQLKLRSYAQILLPAWGAHAHILIYCINVWSLQPIRKCEARILLP